MEYRTKLEAAIDACADRLESLNKAFPRLASPTTLDGVDLWRRRSVFTPVPPSENQAESDGQARVDSREIAVGLLQHYSLEDVLDLMLESHLVELTLPALVQLIGKREYLAALKRDVKELSKNSISFDQIAALWNDLERPGFGGAAWNGRRVSMLAGG